MNGRLLSFMSAFVVLALLSATGLCGVPLFTAEVQTSTRKAPLAAHDRVEATSNPHNAPVMFIENVGQWDEGARFRVRDSSAGTIWLAEDAIWVKIIEPPASGDATSRIDPVVSFDSQRGGLQAVDEPRKGTNVKISFIDANPHPVLEPFDRLDTVVSYFLGNDPAQWRPDVPVWGGVRYVDLYPGVDLELTSQAGQLVPHLVTQPGADLSTVRLRVEGAEAVALDGDALRLSTAAGDLTWSLLRADGSIAEVAVQTRGLLTFEVAAPFAPADLNPPSVIRHPPSPADNPADLLYGTFLGGTRSDAGCCIAIDESGAAYVMGTTSGSDFPTTPGAFDTTLNGPNDAFVLKLNAPGSALTYATFLGGSDSEWAFGIVVDGTGAAYVTGWTASSDFPTTPGAFDTTYNGGNEDAFVAKLNAAGSALAYSTFLGGSDKDHGLGIATDGSGAAYVTGRTWSSDFPTTPGAFDRSFNGGNTDAFVVKLDAAGSDVDYATFLGGKSDEDGNGIAVDGSGAAYVTGATASSDFPTTPGGFDTSYDGFPAFIVKLNAAGSALAYGTFLGGSDSQFGCCIAVDGSGTAYVTGVTWSSDFPTTPGAFDTTYNGGSYDAFVAKLNAVGSDLDYATFLGGSTLDAGGGIAVNRSNAACVTGNTYSPDFPTTPGAFDTSYSGYYSDAFVVKLNAVGSDLDYATFLGGSGSDYGFGIAVDGNGAAYITGYTSSWDFPSTPGAFDTSHNGDADAYAAKLAVPVPAMTRVYLPVVLRSH